MQVFRNWNGPKAKPELAQEWGVLAHSGALLAAKAYVTERADHICEFGRQWPIAP